jgi:hypothetical protein
MAYFPRRWTSGRVRMRRVLPDLDLQIKMVGLPIFQMEYLFHPERKWRIDYCWPEQKLAVEIELHPDRRLCITEIHP